MNKVYVFPNLTEERYIEKVKKAICSLEEKGYTCILNKDDGTILYGENFKEKCSIDDCDLIVSLGGDGTFLRGCQVALQKDMPICGINCGNLGYLCACQLKDIDELDLDELKRKELYILQFEYEGNTFTALNEVVIGKDYFGGTIELEYECKDYTKRFKGDGLIVCTATGSTAYNVSAGGKAFKEEDELIGITPICPYTRDAKALRVDQRNRVRIRLVDKKYSASIFADGRLIGKLDEITVRLSERKIKVLNNN